MCVCGCVWVGVFVGEREREREGERENFLYSEQKHNSHLCQAPFMLSCTEIKEKCIGIKFYFKKPTKAPF